MSMRLHRSTSPRVLGYETSWRSSTLSGAGCFAKCIAPASSCRTAWKIPFREHGLRSPHVYAVCWTKNSHKLAARASSGTQREHESSRDLLSQDTKNLLTIRDGAALVIHWGPEKLDGGVIDPSFFGQNLYTTDIRSRGDKFSMYYINDADAEEIVTSPTHSGEPKIRYEVQLPLDTIYEFNCDPLNLFPRAEDLFRKEWGSMADFNPNHQAEYIGLLAQEMGFAALIMEWRGTRRVDVFVPLQPSWPPCPQDDSPGLELR